ncbi:MAG: hypothetical protein QM737_01180 [Ferruginibacter sp.]
MEIKHFIFGKFKEREPDFGIRIMSPALDITLATNCFKKIMRIKQLCDLTPDIPSYIECIGREEKSGVYFYVRFFPSKNNIDEFGSEMTGFFHAMIFNEQDLNKVDFRPWRCKDRFVKIFDSEKIIGWDNSVWLDSEELKFSGHSVKKIAINIDHVYSGNKPISDNALYKSEDNSIQFIQTLNVYSCLEDLESSSLVRMFNMGVILNYPVESGEVKYINDDIKFVLGKNNLLTEYTDSNWKNLTQASLKSYVGSLKYKDVKIKPQVPGKNVYYKKDTEDLSSGTKTKGENIEMPEVNYQSYESDVVARLKRQNRIFFITVIVCLLAVFLLIAWLLVKREEKNIVTQPVITDSVTSQKPVNIPIPETVVTTHEDADSTNISNLLKQYKEVTGSLDRLTIQHNSLITSSRDLLGKYNSLLAQQKPRMDSLKNALDKIHESENSKNKVIITSLEKDTTAKAAQIRILNRRVQELDRPKPMEKDTTSSSSPIKIIKN